MAGKIINKLNKAFEKAEEALGCEINADAAVFWTVVGAVFGAAVGIDRHLSIEEGKIVKETIDTFLSMPAPVEIILTSLAAGFSWGASRIGFDGVSHGVKKWMRGG